MAFKVMQLLRMNEESLKFCKLYFDKSEDDLEVLQNGREKDTYKNKSKSILLTFGMDTDNPLCQINGWIIIFWVKKSDCCSTGTALPGRLK